MQKLTILFGLLAISLRLAVSPASATLLINVNKSTQTLTVSRDGEVLHRWPVSTGRTGFGTPSGSFTATRMEAEHFSKEWDDAPMPHSVFFTQRGHAIHGTFDTRRLGSPVSHGCVRLAPANAAKLFALVKQEGLANTRVLLSGSEQVALAHSKARRYAERTQRKSYAETGAKTNNADGDLEAHSGFYGYQSGIGFAEEGD
ncbi:L,D-transpeptidase [Rhodoplanes sp. Z2-YC6860]|uniref:L,D-transpeptidase n=1 Tax=Rhodoplanes sp. Z2-YC6860 TaxID=674703 RepID=UPI00078D16A2|nr:L,D-transpeptidase [Rhodoplanes sp. Z2-YC6860]AMN44099.1 ErfK/YbiS/YcfS/YnhG family protein [Rhodoplanes sp. Z2-YC6860]